MTPIEEMLVYIENVVEQPNLIFGGLPICPFARQARQNGLIKFIVQELDENILDFCQNFDKNYEVLIVIHPTKDGMTYDKLKRLTNFINSKLEKYIAFSGHPDHDFQVAGLYTNREPYPNIQVISLDHLKKSADLLRKTNYYNLWDQFTTTFEKFKDRL